MLSIRFVGVGVGVRASQIPLSVLVRNPHKGLTFEISYETRRRQGKARSQSRTEEGIQQKRAVKRREQEQRPVDSEAGLANVRGWVSVPGGFVGISLEYTLAIAHRCTESYTKVSKTSLFFRLELKQACVCLLSFLPPSQLCILCFLCL